MKGSKRGRRISERGGRVSTTANETNNATSVVIAIAIVKFSPKTNMVMAVFPLFLPTTVCTPPPPPLAPSSTPGVFVFNNWIHPLSSPSPSTPAPLHRRPVIYRRTTSHLTTLPLPSFACFGQGRSSSWQTSEERKTERGQGQPARTLLRRGWGRTGGAGRRAHNSRSTPLIHHNNNPPTCSSS